MCYHSHSLMLSSMKLKPTPAQCILINYLQHPKKGYFLAIQSGMRLTCRGAPNDMGRIITCAKKHKKVKKLERKYYTNNLCIIDGANLYQFHHFKYFLGNSS